MQERTDKRISAVEREFESTVEPSRTHRDLPSFGRILVAYDGTQMSKKALNYAAYISKISDSEIVIINVVNVNRDLSNVLPITIKASLQGKEEQLDIAGNSRGVLPDGILREVIEEMITACKVSGITEKIILEICEGDPADEIINLSNLIHFDLIVMGSRRIASRIKGVGSTTRKIAATSKTPLLIVQRQLRYKDEW